MTATHLIITSMVCPKIVALQTMKKNMKKSLNSEQHLWTQKILNHILLSADGRIF